MNGRIIGAIAVLVAGAVVVAVARQSTPTPATEPTTHGEWVRYANERGDSIRAYVAYPERAGRAPAVIVIHEIFGMTDWEPTVADEYAAKGYVAIAPDLLSARFGSTGAVADSARQLVSALSRDEVVRDLRATFDHVASLPATDSSRIGTIGFCWGGQTVWQFAAGDPRLKAAVVCYGPVTDTTMLASVNAPVLGVYGENDGRVNNPLPAVSRIMQSLGKPFAADSYPGTGHGFLKPGRNGHGTPAAAKAQADIDAFFRRHLDGN